eukprot:1628623-Pyramimonas_sp.AAC.1
MTIPCSNFGGGGHSQSSGRVSGGDLPPRQRRELLPTRVRSRPSQTCQDIGDHNHETSNRFVDQAVDDAVAMM